LDYPPTLEVNMSTTDSQTLKTLLDAGTAVISDVFDNLGMVPQSLDTSLFGLETPARPFAGPAYTIAGESHLWADGSGDRKKLAAIDEMTPGVVPVWAGSDIRGSAVLGTCSQRP
jgi:hypothetical protein